MGPSDRMDRLSTLTFSWWSKGYRLGHPSGSLACRRCRRGDKRRRFCRRRKRRLRCSRPAGNQKGWREAEALAPVCVLPLASIVRSVSCASRCSVPSRAVLAPARSEASRRKPDSSGGRSSACCVPFPPPLSESLVWRGGGHLPLAATSLRARSQPPPNQPFGVAHPLSLPSRPRSAPSTRRAAPPCTNPRGTPKSGRALRSGTAAVRPPGAASPGAPPLPTPPPPCGRGASGGGAAAARSRAARRWRPSLSLSAHGGRGRVGAAPPGASPPPSAWSPPPAAARARADEIWAWPQGRRGGGGVGRRGGAAAACPAPPAAPAVIRPLPPATRLAWTAMRARGRWRAFAAPRPSPPRLSSDDDAWRAPSIKAEVGWGATLAVASAAAASTGRRVRRAPQPAP